jgi:hypothetical protein
MPQFGGKDSKRHFTVVMGGKEHGLYVSSTPSSAAKKAVTKLCTANKSKKVEFHIREITQGSKKKTYGPYSGYIEKLKEPIELKGRVIKYKPVAKLSGKSGAKKGGMRGGWWIDDLKDVNDIEKEYMKEFWDMLKQTKNNSIKKYTLIINQKYPQIHKDRKDKLRKICIEWSKRNWIDELEDVTEIEKQYIRFFYDLRKKNPLFHHESYKYERLYPEIINNRKKELNNILSKKKYDDLLNSYFRTPVTKRPGYDPRLNKPYNPVLPVNNNEYVGPN